MKMLDRVHVNDFFKGKDKVPAVVLEVRGEHALIDTIVGGAFIVPLKNLTEMPMPKAILILKQEVSAEEIKNFKALWDIQMGKK